MADAYRVVEGEIFSPGHGGAPPRRRFGVRGGRVWIVATAALLLVAVVASTAVLTFRTAKVPASRSTDDSWVDSLAALSRGRGTVIHASGGSRSGSGSEARTRTSDAPPSIGFVAVGDWGRDDDDARASAATLAVAAAAVEADFAMGLGDNFYTYGVTGPQDPRFETQFARLWAMPNVPWYLVQGNHDYLTNPTGQMDYSHTEHKDPRWNLPGYVYSQLLRGGDGNASFTVQVVGVDTVRLLNHHFDEHYRLSTWPPYRDPSPNDMYDYLETILRCSTADWLFVMGHYPIRSDGRGGDTPELHDRLLPLLKRYGVNAYFTGHDHHMSHMVEPGSHLQHFMPASGAMLRPIPDGHARPDYQRFAEAAMGIAAFRATPCDLAVRFVESTPTRRIAYATSVPNYRRDWLLRRRGVRASGTCDPTPTDPTLNSDALDADATTAAERAALAECPAEGAFEPLLSTGTGGDGSGDDAPPPMSGDDDEAVARYKDKVGKDDTDGKYDHREGA